MQIQWIFSYQSLFSLAYPIIWRWSIAATKMASYISSDCTPVSSSPLFHSKQHLKGSAVGGIEWEVEPLRTDQQQQQ